MKWSSFTFTVSPKRASQQSCVTVCVLIPTAHFLLQEFEGIFTHLSISLLFCRYTPNCQVSITVKKKRLFWLNLVISVSYVFCIIKFSGVPLLALHSNNSLNLAVGISSLIRWKAIAFLGVFISDVTAKIYSSIYGNVASCFYITLLSEAPSVP